MRFLVVVLFCLTVNLFSDDISRRDVSIKPKFGKVCISTYCFDVEIVDRPILRSLGLMGRESLPLRSGMWFVFDGLGKYTFWMKNMLISLDILFVNEQFEIVHLVENARPCSTDDCKLYKTRFNAKYVLEINAGLSSRYGFSEGDMVVFSGVSN